MSYAYIHFKLVTKKYVKYQKVNVNDVMMYII